VSTTTKVIRVPAEVQEEAMELAALRRQQSGHLIADAWREYMANHREEFAADLEKAAALLRDGTLEELAAFASRNVEARASAAHQRAHASRVDS
jgi:hypothetical protein